ncbi:MAG: RsmE family RNA methyltransferase, partial [Actinomycetota bacterium]|nr:RsmE family RNA methyltransferase [Actinomycetota bacterium]
DEEHHHVRVLRLRRGEEALLLDGRGMVYRAVVAEITPRRTRLEILDRRREEEERPRFLLYQSTLPSSRMEEALRRSVELGVGGVIPFLSRRSRPLPDPGRLERWRRVVRDASRVAGRAYLPRVEEPLTWEGLIGCVSSSPVTLLADERGGIRVAEALRGMEEEVALLVGPEGGFEIEEREQLLKAGAVSVTLGRYNLRAESAGAVMLAAGRAFFGLL